MLTLLRSSKHGPGSPWSDDDYNVVDDEGDVGWIVWTASSYTAERDKPWFWSITCKFPNEVADRGNAASLEDAVQAFKARWVAVSTGGKPRHASRCENAVYRRYREIGLQLRNKTPKRPVRAKLRDNRRPPTRLNETWAMDFVHDKLATGRKLRVLPIVDTF